MKKLQSRRATLVYLLALYLAGTGWMLANYLSGVPMAAVGLAMHVIVGLSVSYFVYRNRLF